MGHAGAFGTDLRIPKVRETSSTAMTDRSILRCPTSTKTSSAVVGLRQARHANSYHHGRCPPSFTHAVADGDIGRNDGEIGGECKHSYDDNGSRSADLLPGRPGNPAHFLLQFLEVILGLSRPLTRTLHPAIRFHEIPTVLRFLAGAEGLEPPNAVLETAVLPLKLRPCCGKEPMAPYQFT